MARSRRTPTMLVSRCSPELSSYQNYERNQKSHSLRPEPTCLWQVKGGMNAEIDIDSIGFVFCSLGELVTFLIFRVFDTPNRKIFQNSQKAVILSEAPRRSIA